jgi:hypothetical protein
LRNICCYNGSLPQGAPTSPSLSNLCNQLLDARLAAVAKKIKGKYTRYSDDITFSFSKTYAHQKGILRKINDILESEGYQIQKKKRIRIQRSHQRQITTGLIVNEKLNLPRETRKRIRAMRHHLFMGKLSEVEIRCLAGYENLLKQIDEVNKTNPKKKIELNKLLKISRGTDSQINTKRVLFLASSPINENRLNLDREAREIDESLRRSRKRDLFTLEQKWAIRNKDLRRALLDYRPQIAHFSGHGSGDNGIVLQDFDGNSKFMRTEALVDLFQLFSKEIECVILNACFSEVQADAISQHIKYVIGMNKAIGDTAAIEFSIGFYDALGAGETYEKAFQFGCNAINSANLPDYLIPQIKICHEN